MTTRRFVDIRGVDQTTGAELFHWSKVDADLLDEPMLVLGEGQGARAMMRTKRHLELAQNGTPVHVLTYRQKVETRIDRETFLTAMSFTFLGLVLIAIALIAPQFALGWVSVNMPFILCILLAISLWLILKHAKTTLILSILIGAVLPIAFFILLVFNSIVFDNPGYSFLSASMFAADQMPLPSGTAPMDPAAPVDYVAVGTRVAGLLVELWSVILVLLPWSIIATTLLGMDAVTAAAQKLLDRSAARAAAQSNSD